MAIGILFTKKGGESVEEYFLSGRNVSWWLAGASMVATTFAADTPLVVTGPGLREWRGGQLDLVEHADERNAHGVLLRSALAPRRRDDRRRVRELRYSGKPAAVLRGFRALYLALPINLIILGWVTKAMIKILTISLGLHPVNILGVSVSGEIIAVGICFLITVAYSTGAGMWAVLWTDLVQFVIKMSAVIILAVYAVRAVGGMDKLKEGVSAHFGSSNAALSVLPVRWSDGGIAGYAWMPLLTLAVFLSVQWWAAWYPGAEPGGGGYVAQRIFSSRRNATACSRRSRSRSRTTRCGRGRGS
jgi:Na+/proline symporter